MRKIYIVISLITLFSSLAISQSEWSEVLDIQFGYGEYQINLGEELQQREKISIASFPAPRDILIGKDGLIYIPDKNGWRILVYDKNGRFSRTIGIPQKDIKTSQFGVNIYLVEDPDERIYVHVTYQDRLFALYRFDKDNDGVFEFPFIDVKPKGDDVVGSIFSGGSGHIYIPSTPSEILRSNWENRIYKYDSDGRFLGMVDYFIEDSEGNIYQPGIEKDDEGYLWKFKKFGSPDTPTATTGDLDNLKTLSIPIGIKDDARIEQSYVFRGFDNDMKIYVANESFVRIYEPPGELRWKVPLHLDILEHTMGFLSRYQNIKISPNGQIYIFGLQTPRGKRELSYDASEVRFMVLRLAM